MRIQFWVISKIDSQTKCISENIKTYGSHHAKMYLRACADSKGPDQPAHPRRLIRAFAVCDRIIRYYRMLNGEQMPGLGFAFVQDNASPHILRMLKGAFSLNTAKLINRLNDFMKIYMDIE